MRLAKFLKNTHLIRICNWKRKPEALPIELSQYTQTDSKGYFVLPNLSDIVSKFVICCTCVTAGAMAAKGFAIDFTHIIVDEASQAMEPEILLPLQFLNAKTTVVLSGDPCQLGPSVRHPLAHRLLSVSLLERLMSAPPYHNRQMVTGGCSQSKCNSFITMLNLNYRSHFSIISVRTHYLTTI